MTTQTKSETGSLTGKRARRDLGEHYQRIRPVHLRSLFGLMIPGAASAWPSKVPAFTWTIRRIASPMRRSASS